MIDKNNFNNQNVFIKFLRMVLIIILLPIVLIYLIHKSIKSLKNKKKYTGQVKVFGISQVDSFSGEEFELFLKQIFEKQGYNVSLTKATGDFGADLICKKQGKTLLVQAKCFGNTVGVKAVQEVIGAKNHYKSNDAMVVTNNYFSKEANILAIENNVRLVDRTVLINLISKYDLHFDRTKFGYSCLKSAEIQKIEARYKFWI